MAREAILEINCSRYSERIIDVINLFNEVRWKYYDAEKNIEYLPLGDNDDFDWQKKFLSENELQELINDKQDTFELVALNLYYENSEEGLTLLAKNTKKIAIDLNINPFQPEALSRFADLFYGKIIFCYGYHWLLSCNLILFF